MFEPGKLADLIASKPSTTEPFSLESLIAWLETMPADQEYCWEHAGECLFHQYGAAHGMKAKSCYSIYAGTMLAFGPDIHGAQIASSQPHTFGAALTRARAYAAKVSP